MASSGKRSHSLPTGNIPVPTREKNHFRITVMGASGVGKSCIISRFLYNKFSFEYKETVEDLHRGKYDMKGKILILDILDTAGAYSFPAMRELAISASDAFVLVYAVNSSPSFDEVSHLREHILRIKKAIPIVIVGNKMDIKDGALISNRKSIEALVCVEWGDGFVEVSARNNTEIVPIFNEVLRRLNVKCDLKLPRQRSFSLPDEALGGSTRKKPSIKKKKRHCFSVS